MRLFGWFRRPVRGPIHDANGMHRQICPSVNDGTRYCYCACERCYDPSRGRGLGCVCAACWSPVHGHRKVTS